MTSGKEVDVVVCAVERQPGTVVGLDRRAERHLALATAGGARRRDVGHGSWLPLQAGRTENEIAVSCMFRENPQITGLQADAGFLD